MTGDPKATLRADGRRNRDQILTTAREVFAARGADVPMEEMARTAGVGVGTLYRHFPDREALILAVARESLTQVLEDARTASAEEPTGWDALVRLLGRTRQLQVAFQLTWNSVRARGVLHGDREAQELKDALLAELDRIVRRAQDEGTMRRDVAVGDVAVLIALVLRQPPAVVGPELFGLERVTGVVLEGLRANPEGVLPNRPLTAEDVERWRTEHFLGHPR